MNTEKGLLEELVIRTGCAYLSDLHQPYVLEKIKRALLDMEKGHYTVKAWQDGFTYITGKENPGENEEDIRQMFAEER